MIYLDNNATTLIDPRVKKAIDALYCDGIPIGNPSSPHRLGQKAKGHLNAAIQSISLFLNVRPDELIFTSGATEGLNLLIQGLCIDKGHIISSAFEHPATLHSLQLREKKGDIVTYLKTSTGTISLLNVKEALQPDTKLIVLMAVNNETGIKNDIDEIAQFANQHQIPMIVDGVALLGKEFFSIPKGVTAMCFSGHKIHAPTGIGFSFIRKGTKISPMIVGGPQQRGRRSGTENLIGIVGLAKAMEILQEELPEATTRMETLRNHLEESLTQHISKVIIHGKKEKRICNVSNMSFPHFDGETLLMKLDLEGIAVSYGAACSTGGLEPSHVLMNMQISTQEAISSLRFSLSRFTTLDEINMTAKVLIDFYNSLENSQSLFNKMDFCTASRD